jgi:hypothetical protein
MRKKTAEPRQPRAATPEPPTPTATATASHEAKRKPDATHQRRTILVRSEFDEPGAHTIAAALRLASRIYKALADSGFISPTTPDTLRAIAAPDLLAKKIENAIADDRAHQLREA